MDTCIISPISGLRKYSTLSNMHLVLVHIDDVRYQRFYQERNKDGDFLILDNGAYERREFDEDREFRMIDFYEPDVVVLPDSPFSSGKKTFYDSMKFLNKCKQRNLTCEFMAVPQSFHEDWKNWWEWTIRFLTIKEVDYLGISKLLARTFRVFSSYDRTRLAKAIKSLKPNIKLHALGMLNGDLVDYMYCKEVYDSLDTAVPVGRGFRGIRIGEPYSVTEDLNFNLPFDESMDEVIQDNLRLLGIRPKVKEDRIL